MNLASLASVLTVAALAAPAAAGPLADALARHAGKDVDSLRAQRGDQAARCTLGAVYAKRDDLSRAALYLTGCDEATLPDEISADIARIDRDVKKRLRDTDLARIEVITYPENMVGEIDALPGDTFATPATVYVKPGQYKVNAVKDGVVLSNTVVAVKHGRTPVILGGEPRTGPAAPKNRTIDLTDDHGADTQNSGPPPAVKHGSMLKGRYAAGVAATERTADDPEGLQDPMAVRSTGPRTRRDHWLGLRLGGGMFDDGASSARAGVMVAVTGRHDLAGRAFLAGRLDWSRRGGDAADSIDVLGASAGAGYTVVDSGDLGLALIAQLRGDLRLAGERMTAPVSRAGVAAAAGIELALPRSPFTAGIRFEQGLTTLVPGARDRAVLLELGVDLR